MCYMSYYRYIIPFAVRGIADGGPKHCLSNISGKASGMGMLRGATQRCRTHLVPAISFEGFFKKPLWILLLSTTAELVPHRQSLEVATAPMSRAKILLKRPVEQCSLTQPKKLFISVFLLGYGATCCQAVKHMLQYLYQQ